MGKSKLTLINAINFADTKKMANFAVENEIKEY